MGAELGSFCHFFAGGVGRGLEADAGRSRVLGQVGTCPTQSLLGVAVEALVEEPAQGVLGSLLRFGKLLNRAVQFGVRIRKTVDRHFDVYEHADTGP